MGKNMTAKKKSKHKPPVTMTRAKIESLKREISWNTLILFMACCMDEMDWTDEEVQDFSIRLHRYMDAAESHLLTYNKIAKIVSDTIGVDVRIWT